MLNKEIAEKILTYTDVSFRLVYDNEVKEFCIRSNFTDIIKLLNVPYDSFSPTMYKNFVNKLQDVY